MRSRILSLSLILFTLTLGGIAQDVTTPPPTPPPDPGPTGSPKCSDLSTSVYLKQLISGPDTNEHSLGGHWATTGIPGGVDPLGFPVPNPTNKSLIGSCLYSAGNSANCDGFATVNLLGGAATGETGKLNTAGSHLVNWGWQNGTDAEVGGAAGAKATAYFGAGAANCANVVGGICLPSISVSALGISMNTAGSKVWLSSSNPASVGCAVQADPAKKVADTGAGGGDPGTAPCDTTDPSITGDVGDGFSTPPPLSCPPSPIIIDTEGDGFHLTSAADGVEFDIRGDGHPIRIGWTAQGSHNAFLALDRNGDGKITSGKELFGNFTAQPPSSQPNGFLALALFDDNHDNIIDAQDSVWTKLVLWIDDNHDGIAQPSEIHKLSEFGIQSLSLSYFESRKRDSFGNQFRYRARVNPVPAHREVRDRTTSGEPGRWAYDVFFTVK